MKLLIIKFCLIFSLIIQINTDFCYEASPKKNKCLEASVTEGYYKCCFFEGRVDLVSTAEKILMALSAFGDVQVQRTEEKIINFCRMISKEDYDDIENYIKKNKEIHIQDESMKFDSVSIDCHGKYFNINLIILIVLLIF
jgi:hypothetical protein